MRARVNLADKAAVQAALGNDADFPKCPFLDLTNPFT